MRKLYRNVIKNSITPRTDFITELNAAYMILSTLKKYLRVEGIDIYTQLWRTNKIVLTVYFIIGSPKILFIL